MLRCSKEDARTSSHVDDTKSFESPMALWKPWSQPGLFENSLKEKYVAYKTHTEHVVKQPTGFFRRYLWFHQVFKVDVNRPLTYCDRLRIRKASFHLNHWVSRWCCRLILVVSNICALFCWFLLIRFQRRNQMAIGKVVQNWVVQESLNTSICVLYAHLDILSRRLHNLILSETSCFNFLVLFQETKEIARYRLWIYGQFIFQNEMSFTKLQQLSRFHSAGRWQQFHFGAPCGWWQYWTLGRWSLSKGLSLPDTQ